MSFQLFDDLLRLFFPETCAVCRQTLVRGEEVMCLNCLSSIPITNFHLKPEKNPMIEKLVDKNAPIGRAVAYFHYRKENPFAMLIQEAKYNNRPQIARILSRNYALSIAASGFFQEIDAIVPVPIHWMKHLRRGYNQTHYLAAGISDVTNIPVLPLLKAAKPHKSQTRKSGAERKLLSTKAVFTFDSEHLSSLSTPIGGNSHLLLVDDVVTTGSTILACARALHKALPGAKISVLSLATTHN